MMANNDLSSPGRVGRSVSDDAHTGNGYVGDAYVGHHRF